MKTLFLILCFIVSIGAYAQDLVSGEYFFDNEPGIGNGNALASFTANDTVPLNLNISTTGLNVGFHELYIRFKDVNGVWGQYENKTFYIQDAAAIGNAPNLFSAEYFFDTDPGFGNGLSLPAFNPADSISFSFNTAVSTLSPGQHSIYVRFKDSVGVWGIYEGASFTVLNCSSPATDFTFSSQNLCLGDNLILMDNSTGKQTGATYKWDVNDDGIIESTASSYTYTVNTTQAFNVKLVVNNGACSDSVIKSFTVDTINSTVSQTGLTLTANQIGAAYQWLDCNNSFAAISGETARQFVSNVSGNFAVEITNGACVDTSNCFNLILIGIGETEESVSWTVYPNPSIDGVVFLSFGREVKEAQLRLLDLSGKAVYQELLRNSSSAEINFNQSKGVYFLEMTINGNRVIKKLVLN